MGHKRALGPAAGLNWFRGVGVALSNAAIAQQDSQPQPPAAAPAPAAQTTSPAVPYLGPGTYSTYGPQTYGPGGTQFNLGNGLRSSKDPAVR